jgi:hypothetical protein
MSGRAKREHEREKGTQVESGFFFFWTMIGRFVSLLIQQMN